MSGLYGPLYAEKKGEDEGELVNRKVLILDFVNSQKSDLYAYLETSIPDAFLSPLDKTRVFELLSRSIWTELQATNGFKKEDAYLEHKAIQVGRLADADVVVIGSFAVMENEIHIFTKAIEVSSKRAIISRSTSSAITGSMFRAIEQLAKEMAAEMKEKLPPVKQKVVTKRQVIDTSKTTHVGMIWRNALLPGWGHLYAKQGRGFIYMGAFLVAAGVETWFYIDYKKKFDVYQNSTTDLQLRYDEANKASLLVGVGLIGVGVLYVVPLIDIIITGRRYDQSRVSQLIERPVFTVATRIPQSGSGQKGSGYGYDIALHLYY